MTAWISAFVIGLAAAQQVPPVPMDSGVSDAVVQELRALREAVEGVLSTSVRVQLLMGRLQLQETRIQSLVQQSREIDAQLAGMTTDRVNLEQQRRIMERVLNETTDPEQREMAKQEGTTLAERLKHLEARYNTLLADQANVQQLVAAEQNRWGEFNQRLEELERLLAATGR